MRLLSCVCSAKPRRALGEITNRVKSSKSSSSSSGLGVDLWKPTEAPPPPQQPHLPAMGKKRSASVEGLRSAVEAMRLVEEEDDVEVREQGQAGWVVERVRGGG